MVPGQSNRSWRIYLNIVFVMTVLGYSMIGGFFVLHLYGTGHWIFGMILVLAMLLTIPQLFLLQRFTLRLLARPTQSNIPDSNTAAAK